MSSHAAWVAFFDEQQANVQEFRAKHAHNEEDEQILGLLSESLRLSGRAWHENQQRAKSKSAGVRGPAFPGRSDELEVKVGNPESTDADGGGKVKGSPGKPEQLARVDTGMTGMSQAATERGDAEVDIDSIPWQDRAGLGLCTGSLASVECCDGARVQKPHKPRVFRKTPMMKPRHPPFFDLAKTSSSEPPFAHRCSLAVQKDRHDPARRTPLEDADECVIDLALCAALFEGFASEDGESKESKEPWSDIMCRLKQRRISAP
jgi:hypothetical protein